MSIIHSYRSKKPHCAKTAFIAEDAVLVGNVAVGPESSIWYGCVLRGDVNDIKIGARTNIQDGTVIHVSSFGQGTYVGDDVTVGHMALLHACTVEAGAFIGMRATVMDDAKVERGAMVAAGALVTPGKIVPAGQLWGGSPARYMRDLTDDDRKKIAWSAAHYVRLSRDYL